MNQPTLPFQFLKERNPHVYYNDGMGRDTYISFNNGGNFGADMRFLVKGSERSSMKMGPTSPSRADQVLP
jgi:hypothetical protein